MEQAMMRQWFWQSPGDTFQFTNNPGVLKTFHMAPADLAPMHPLHQQPQLHSTPGLMVDIVRAFIFIVARAVRICGRC